MGLKYNDHPNEDCEFKFKVLFQTGRLLQGFHSSILQNQSA